MDSAILGQYVPGRSLIHRLDPRTKLLGSVWFVTLLFFVNSAAGYAALSLFVVGAMKLSEIPLRYFMKSMKPLLFLIIFTTTLQFFFAPGETVWFEWGLIRITREGLIETFFIIIRFMLIIFMSTLLTLTTMPLAIADGLESLLAPFGRFGLPVHELALILSIALRFVPTLMTEANKIRDAQTARGATFGEGSLKEQMGAIIPLLIPLFINSIDRAEELATAMTARGYRGGEGRTRYRQIKYTVLDGVSAGLMLALTLFVVGLRYL